MCGALFYQCLAFRQDFKCLIFIWPAESTYRYAGEGGNMVDTEMLSAISDLLEEKLEQKLDAKFDQKLQPLYDKIDSMEERMDSMENRMDSVEKRLGNLEQDVHYIKVVQLENDIRPRLSTIESCYLDTYKRYQKSTEKIDSMAENIEILNLTVSEHSSKLAHLSV